MNDEAKEKLFARIRHLAAMTVANGCSESEAATAAGMLADLLRKHNLTKDEAALREDPFVRHREQHMDAVGQRLWKVADGAAHLTGCRYWVDRQHKGTAGEVINFFGFDHEVEVAKYMLAICAHAMRSERDRLHRLHLIRSEAARRGIIVPFLDGMADGLRRRLRAMKPTTPPGKGLIVLHDQLVEQAMKDAGHELGKGDTRKSRDFAPAYVDGLRAAEAVALNPGLAGSLNAKQIT